MQIALRLRDPFAAQRTLVTVSSARDAATVAAAVEAVLARHGYRTERAAPGAIDFRFGGMSAWFRKNGQPEAPCTRGRITVAACPTGEVVMELSVRFDTRFVVGYILCCMLLAVGLPPFWPMRLVLLAVFLFAFHQLRAAWIQNLLRGIHGAAPFRELRPVLTQWPAPDPGER